MFVSSWPCFDKEIGLCALCSAPVDRIKVGLVALLLCIFVCAIGFRF